MLRRSSLALSFTLFLGLAACKQEKSRWDEASSTAASAVAAKEAQKDQPKIPVKTGSDLNKVVPADGVEGTKRVAVAEDNSRGYVEWKYQKDGKDLVTITVVDAADKPEVKSKFEGVTEKIEGYPAFHFGKNQSSILVEGRFQVKIISQVLDKDARAPWFGKVDLKALAAQK